jgi:serine/threonine protein kinase
LTGPSPEGILPPPEPTVAEPGVEPDMHTRTVGPYTLLSVLGMGRFGHLHLARTEKGTRVAVRVIRREFAADRWFRACLREQVDVVARIRSPRVAAVLDADVDADAPWLAMEYVPAPSIAALLSRCGPLSVDGVRRLGVELAEALEAIHGAGAVHRDLRPGNVLVTAAGPRVVDASVARAAAASSLTRGGGLIGAPGYLAPEQLLNGPGEPASDVFALGSVLLHAATWRAPFGTGDVVAVLHRMLRVGPDLRGLDPGVVPIVAACLHPDPTRRPTSREVRDALAEPAAKPPAPATGNDDPPVAESSPDDARPEPAPADAIPAQRAAADHASEDAAARVSVGDHGSS